MDVFAIIGQGGQGRPGQSQAASAGEGAAGAFAALLAGEVGPAAVDALGLAPSPSGEAGAAGAADTAALLLGDSAPTPVAPTSLPAAIGPLDIEAPMTSGLRLEAGTTERRPQAPTPPDAPYSVKPVVLAAASAPSSDLSIPVDGTVGEAAKALPAEAGDAGRPAGTALATEALPSTEAPVKAAQTSGETARAASAPGAAAPAESSGDRSFADDRGERSPRSGPEPQLSSPADEQIRPAVTAAESGSGKPSQLPEAAKAVTGATAMPPSGIPTSAPTAEPAPVPLANPALQGAAPLSAASSAPAPEVTTGRAGAAASEQSEILAIRIQKAVQAGQDRISLRLHPAELGRIDVQLEFADDGRLRAAILAERGEALDLLQRDARVLERALQEAGLKTDSGSFTFDLRDQSAHEKHQSRGVDGAASNNADDSADLEEDLAAKPGPGSHSGLLDLTV